MLASIMTSKVLWAIAMVCFDGPLLEAYNGKPRIESIVLNRGSIAPVRERQLSLF